MHKLAVKTEQPWRIFIELDGQPAFVPLDEDGSGFSIESDGPLYVTFRGQRFPLQAGREAWEAILDQVYPGTHASGL